MVFCRFVRKLEENTAEVFLHPNEKQATVVDLKEIVAIPARWLKQISLFSGVQRSVQNSLTTLLNSLEQSLKEKMEGVVRGEMEKEGMNLDLMEKLKNNNLPFSFSHLNRFKEWKEKLSHMPPFLNLISFKEEEIKAKKTLIELCKQKTTLLSIFGPHYKRVILQCVFFVTKDLSELYANVVSNSSFSFFFLFSF